MELDKIDIDTLIVDYLTHQLDDESREKLEKWVSESSENELYFQEQLEIWFSAMSDSENLVYDKKKAFNRFKDYVSSKQFSVPSSHRISFTGIVYRCIAAAVLVLVASVVSHLITKLEMTENFADIVIESPAQSKTKVSLPDGTVVWMNANSKITYSQGFAIDERRLTFAGEGYFEVAANAELPFTVHMEELNVQVLGTKFNVRNYSDEEEAVVFLKEGKIALKNLLQQDSEAVLSPNDRVVLNKTSKNMHKQLAHSLNDVQWRKRILFFDEMLLSDLARQLERTYEVHIHFASERIKKYRFYGLFQSDEQDIAEVLHILSSTHKFSYRISGKHITLYQPNN